MILLDLMMPVMDGHAFRAEQLKDPRLAEIPVVVVSAYRDANVQAEQLKASRFLKKPPALDEMLAAIEDYC
jgi:CheY-like chemotaxis protein